MSTYRLSAHAQDSIKTIRAYSLGQFGKNQTNIYISNLKERMQWLAANPERGKPRDAIKHGYYSYFEGSHTIYYVMMEEDIGIIDILHQSMEPMLHLSTTN